MIVLVPPVMPTLQSWLPPFGSTCGALITSLSSTIAIIRGGVLTGWQAALPVRSAQILPPSPLKFIWTNQPWAACCGSSRPSEPPTISPVIAGFASRRKPGAVLAAAGKLTGGRLGRLGRDLVEHRVEGELRGLADHLRGLARVLHAGQLDDDPVSPCRVTLGSLTPRASTRRRSTRAPCPWTPCSPSPSASRSPPARSGSHRAGRGRARLRRQHDVRRQHEDEEREQRADEGRAVHKQPPELVTRDAGGVTEQTRSTWNAQCTKAIQAHRGGQGVPWHQVATELIDASGEHALTSQHPRSVVDCGPTVITPPPRWVMSSLRRNRVRDPVPTSNPASNAVTSAFIPSVSSPPPSCRPSP